MFFCFVLEMRKWGGSYQSFFYYLEWQMTIYFSLNTKKRRKTCKLKLKGFFIFASLNEGNLYNASLISLAQAY